MVEAAKNKKLKRVNHNRHLLYECKRLAETRLKSRTSVLQTVEELTGTAEKKALHMEHKIKW